MRAILCLTFLSLVVNGCRTSNATSSIANVETRSTQLDASRFKNTKWRYERDDPTFRVVINVTISSELAATLEAVTDDQSQSAKYQLRVATQQELDTFIQKTGASTIMNSQGHEVSVKQGLSAFDEDGNFTNMFVVLGDNELYLHPSGPLKKINP